MNNNRLEDHWETILRHASLDLQMDDTHSIHSIEDRLDRPAVTISTDQQANTPAAVLVAFTRRANETQLVLTKRSAQLSAHRGQIAFPGGKIDKQDKTPVFTAMREAEEEIGVSRDQICIMGKLPLYETGTGFIITPITAIIHPPYEFVRQESEVEEIFEVPLSFVASPSNYQKNEVMLDGVRRQFWVLPYKDYYIWGATAAILIDLANRIGKAHDPDPEQDFIS